MNDYLWDKTGSDPEIEALESQLVAFRSSVKEPPGIAGDVQSAKSVRGFFRIPITFKFAMAGACALLVLFAAAGPFRFAFSEVSKTSIDFSGPARVSAVPIPDAPASDDQKYATDRPSPVRTSARRETRRTPRVRPAAARRDTEIRTSSDLPADQLASLTVEERHAYDQLMLALSITSSRLKMVQDIADGNDGITPAGAGADKSSIIQE